MKYTQRLLESKLKAYLTTFPSVGISGPRQSGKSTMLTHCLPDYQYVSFDDFKMVNFFSEDPERFMKTYQNNIIFDEVQKVPKLFNYIKIAIDQDRHNAGKFVLTGSSQFDFIRGVSESLAGRIGLLSLLPYQLQEIPLQYKETSIYKGCYPELITNKYKLSQDWYSSYLDTYLKKDVSNLAQIGDKREFQKFVLLLAGNTSQILNFSSYAKNLGVDVKTIKRWLSILEASYIIFLLPPYHNNFGKRIVKSPKIYFYDTGLVAYLTGIQTQEHYTNGPMAGSLFENYIIADLLKNELHKKTNSELYYYRTQHGLEVDLIIDRKSARKWIEIKRNSSFSHRWMQPLATLVPDEDQGVLIYPGENQAYSENLRACNYLEYCDL